MERVIGAIAGIITGIVGIITGNVWLIISGITQVAGAIVYSFNADIGSALLLLGGALAIIGIPQIRRVGAALLQHVRGAASWLAGIIDTVGYYVNLGIEFVADIINDFNQYFNNLLTSTLAPVFDKLREYTDTLSSIFSIAQTVGYFTKGEYVKGVYNLIQWIDVKSAVNLENSLKYLDASIKSLLSTFSKTLGLTRTKLSKLSTDLIAVSDTTRMIGEAFGVKEIVHLSAGIEQFRREVVKETIKELGEFRREIAVTVRYITSPISELIKHFRAVRRDDRRYNRLFSAFIFSGLSNETLWLYPPRKIPVVRFSE